MDRDYYRGRPSFDLERAAELLERRARRLRWIARHLPPSEILTDDQEMALWMLTQEVGNGETLHGVELPDRMQDFPEIKIFGPWIVDGKPR